MKTNDWFFLLISIFIFSGFIYWIFVNNAKEKGYDVKNKSDLINYFIKYNSCCFQIAFCFLNNLFFDANIPYCIWSS